MDNASRNTDVSTRLTGQLHAQQERSNADEKDDNDEILDEVNELIEPSMLWTCTLCDITISIHSRDDHLISRPHARKVGKVVYTEALQPTPTQLPLLERTVCDQGMNLFYHTEHPTDSCHKKMMQNIGIPEDASNDQESIQYPAEAPPIIPGILEKADRTENTFYCFTCATEHPLSFRGEHRGSTVCVICGKPVDDSLPDEHPKPPERLATNAPFYCGSCHTEYPATDQEQHLFCDVEHHPEVKKPVLFSLLDTLPNEPPETFHCKLCEASFATHLKPLHNRPWECIICSERMHASEREAHLDSGAHKPKNLNFTCAICNETYNLAGKEAHVKGEKHRTRVTEQAGLVASLGPKAYGRNAADKYITPTRPNLSFANWRRNVTISSSAPTALPLSATPGPENRPTQMEKYFCAICNKHVQSEAIHLSTKAHAGRVEKARAAQPAQAAQAAETDRFFCTTCSRYVKDEASHLNSKNHRRRQERLAAQEPGYVPPDGMFYCHVCEAPFSLGIRNLHRSVGWDCEVCDITMHLSWKESHVGGGKHTKRQRRQEEEKIAEEGLGMGDHKGQG